MSKPALKLAKEVQKVLANESLTHDQIEWVYENYDPAMDDNCTERGVFFTPLDLCQDVAVFSPKYGHIVDICSGIGALPYRLLCHDYYDAKIKSITLIEMNPHFLEMSKRLLAPIAAYHHKPDTPPVQLNFINASAWDRSMWSSITTAITKFDSCISNPPYGKCSAEEKVEAAWMHYTGERELMALELAWRYSEYATLIIPPMSCPFQYSGRRYYERRPSAKFERFMKAMPKEAFIHLDADGIDCSVHHDSWKNTKITVEVASCTFGPNG